MREWLQSSTHSKESALGGAVCRLWVVVWLLQETEKQKTSTHTQWSHPDCVFKMTTFIGYLCHRVLVFCETVAQKTSNYPMKQVPDEGRHFGYGKWVRASGMGTWLLFVS